MVYYQAVESLKNNYYLSRTVLSDFKLKRGITYFNYIGK